MRRIVFFVAAAMLGMGMVSCGSSMQSTAERTTEGTETLQEPSTEILPQMGEWSGLIPAADTDGIKMTLSIDANGNYRLQEEFGGGKGGDVVEGSARLLKEGTVLELPAVNEESRFFLIVGDTLKMCDKEFNLPEGELAPQYVLIKTPAE